MNFLRARWRRTWVHRYFAVMEPMDRAVALIAILLAAAIAAVFTALLQPAPASIGSSPRLTAPPFVLDFAAAT